jgi:hypothetical protein
MENYKNTKGHSGVTGYEISANSITVVFNNDTAYRYTYKSTGKKAIEKMKQLAKTGRGLSTYISQNVREAFESKIR